MSAPRSLTRQRLLADPLGLVPRHPIARFHTNPSLSQAGYRLRNDDGSETTATWKANENTGATIAVDTTFRVRFVVDETAGGGENNVAWQLQYNLNSAGWNNVTTASSVVRAVDSTNLTDDGATTRQLSSGTGTFLTGRISEDGLTNTTVTFVGGELTELEYVVQIRSADVVNNDSVQLRVIRGSGTVLENYAQTPTITVSESTTTTITPGGIASAEALGGLTQRLTLAPSAIASGEAIGAPRQVFLFRPAGVASFEAFGTPREVLTLAAQAIASGEALGAVVLSEGGAGVTLLPSGIATAEAFGTPRQLYLLTPTGVTSLEAFGTTRQRLTLHPGGAGSAEAFGALIVSEGAWLIAPGGIASLEGLGTPALVFLVSPAGIASAEALGAAELIDGTPPPIEAVIIRHSPGRETAFTPAQGRKRTFSRGGG